MVVKIKPAILIMAISAVFQCLALKYDPSKTYSYSYETDVLMNDANSKRSTTPQQDVGVKLSMTVHVSTLYKDPEVQLFKLLIDKASVASGLRADNQRGLSGTLSLPAFFVLSGDTVDRVHFAATDTTFSRNVKKGIIALFQVQETAGKRTEVDVSGECHVTYALPQPDVVDRVKSDCQNLEIAGLFTTASEALGVSEWKQASHRYKLKDSVIESVTGSHRVITYVNLRSALNGGLTSSQKFQLESVSEGSGQSSSVDEALAAAEKDAGSKLDVSLLPSDEEALQCTQGCESPTSLVAKLAKDLEQDNLATVKSAKAFTELLKNFRNSGKMPLSESFISKDSYYIVPQLLDVATATQTDASREALMELLNFDSADSIEYPQRFLFAAAYSSHPTAGLISDLLSILKKPLPNESLKESIMLSLGAIVHTFCQSQEQCAHKVVTEFQEHLLSSLSACKDSACQLMYLRALGNAGLPGSVTAISAFVEGPREPMVTLTAIQALRRIPRRFISNPVKKSLERVFLEVSGQYDSSVRVAALELLLSLDPSGGVVKAALLTCLDQSNGELSTYLLRMLLDTASVNPQVKDALQNALNDPDVANYNVFAQGGKSSVITSYLAKMKDVNASYNLFFENSPSGVMKRSGMIVSLLGPALSQQLMKFGIYADGLESLVGEEGEEGGEGAVEPTAGMGFTFMDVLLTQVEFFRGTSGLMSAVWNAPSELTSALQGNLLLQDHSQRLHLSNGLVVESQVTGALSIDLSGSVSISLWNRNCEALIRTSGAMYLEGTLKLATEEFDVSYLYSGEGQSNIDFTSLADFYEMPLKLCMEMKRPAFNFVQRSEKREKIKKLKGYKSKGNVKSSVEGESYFLNKANSEECRVMITDDN